MRNLRDTRDADGFSRPLWKAFAEMGFTGILMPRERAGSGSAMSKPASCMEEIGRNLTPSPFLSTAVAAVDGAAARRPARSKALLPRHRRRRPVAALAVDEGAQAPRPSAIALKAERSGNGFSSQRRESSSSSTATSPT